MKWILTVCFLVLNVFAESAPSDLPADVQSEINSTESAPKKKVASAETKKTETKVEATEETAAVTATTESTVDKATAKENEIPLTIGATKKAATSETTYFRIIMIVALLGILASGTWVFVRKAKSQNIKRNKNEIKILAQHYLGPKKSLAVVRVAGESILVGITDAQINMIKTLSLLDDELPEVSTQNFRSELDHQMTTDTINRTSQPAPQASTYNRKSKVNTQGVQSEDEMEEFSIRGIKDLVSSKLKNMRSI